MFGASFFSSNSTFSIISLFPTDRLDGYFWFYFGYLMYNYFGAISVEHSDDHNESDHKTTDSQKSPFIITSFEWHSKKDQKQRRGEW